MRKLKLFTLCAALFSALAAGAQVLVTDAAAELVDGTVIALQCRDYNGGSGWYFNGAAPKSGTESGQNVMGGTLAEGNLYKVVGNATDGLKLQRLSDGKYIGKSGNTVTEVGTAEEAVSFTAVSYNDGNGFAFGAGNKATEMDGTIDNLYVRFIVKDDSNFLNTQPKTNNPNYAGGNGGYSAWYVYKFPEVVAAADLSFNRTDTEAASVTINVAGGEDDQSLEGVTATLVSCSEAFKATAEKVTEAILCPNVNGSADPTIKFRFKLENLPDSFSFDAIALDIHALNGQNGYQQNNDNKKRLFNVALSCSPTEPGDEEQPVWSKLENIDIAAGIGQSQVSVHKWWPLAASPVTIEDGTLYLDITVTKGTENGGCFFGLSGIKFGNFIKTTESASAKADIASLLSAIDDATTKANLPFPAKEEGVDDANIVWPGEYNFSGLNSNFELLTHAQNAAAGYDQDALNAAKDNLTKFIGLSKQYGYPRSFVYTVEEAEYTTAFLPVKASLPTGLELYACEGLEGDVLTLTSVDGGFANSTAYIVKKTAEAVVGQKYQYIGYGNHQTTQLNGNSLLKGTHEDTTAPVGSYVLQTQDNVLGFYLVEDGTENAVPAGKCYLQLPEGEEDGAEAVKLLRFPDGTLTAIDAVGAAKPADAAIYDLSGRRVGTTARGLYITGGRKVLVK